MWIAVVMVMVMVVAAVVLFLAEGEQVEEAKDDEAYAGDEDHGLEDAVGRKVMDDATAGVEIKQDAAPKQQQGDANQVGEETRRTHERQGRG